MLLDETNENRYNDESKTKNPERINFDLISGPAAGYRLVLTQQNIDFHKEKYGGERPELHDDEFIDKKIIEAVCDPDALYQRIEKAVPGEKIILEKNVYVFYKANPDREYTYNSKLIKSYVCVRVRKKRWQKILEVITSFYSPRITEEKKCQPLTRI